MTTAMAITMEEEQDETNALADQTDEDISKRVGLITRLVKTRVTNRDEIQIEIEDLIREKAGLVEEQSRRLKKLLAEITAQLPAVKAVKSSEEGK